MRKIFGITLVIILSLTFITGCGCSNKKNPEPVIEGPISNTNEDVIKDQKIDVFTFKNTSLIYENKNSILKTTVTNTSEETQYLKEFAIHVKDDKGNEIVKLIGYVGDSIAANESKVITSVYADDLTIATSIEYELVK